LVRAAASAAIVPSLRRARRRPSSSGQFARLYVESGVATLIVGLSVLASWVAFALGGGVALALGAPGAAVFGVFRAASALLVAGVAAHAAWGFTFGQWRIEVTTTRVALPKLHAELTGLRLVQISDLHIGNRLDRARLDHMVERTNATRADIVVLTGDLFDFDPSHLEEG